MLPVFLMAVTAFLFYFQVLAVQLRLQHALEQTGQKIAAYYYLVQVLPQTEDGERDTSNLEDELSDALLSYVEDFALSTLEGAYVKAELLSCVSTEWLNKSCIKNGADGVLCYGIAGLMKENLVDLRISYEVQIPFMPSEVFTIPFVQRCVRRAWIGWEAESEEESGTEGETESTQKDVYVTKYGTVYHVYKDCRSLKSEVHVCSPETVKDLRNKDGAIYYACEYCVKGEANTLLYITDYGRRYHNSRVCGALMSYIEAVTPDGVSGKRMCRFCEKRQAEEQ